MTTYNTVDPATLCDWAITGKYRCKECGYSGNKMFDLNNKQTNDPKLDQCSGNFNSCKIRNNEIHFAGFPKINF